MIKKYKSFKYDIPIGESIKQDIMYLNGLMNFDIALLFMFYENHNYTNLECEFIKNQIKYAFNFRYKNIMASESRYNIFKIASNEKKKVLLSMGIGENNQIQALVKDTELELYIPLFINGEEMSQAIGCIYYGSLDKSNPLKAMDIFDNEVGERVLEIQNKCQVLYYDRNSVKESLDIVHVLSEILENRDPYMVSHPYNVANWSKHIAEEMGLDSSSINKIYTAALLHDIGKIYIDEKILNKASKLDESEYQKVKNHSIYGYNIASNLFKAIKGLNEIPEIIKYHHERYDGKGYPEGISREQIPLECRIICMADAIDAMLSQRSYKNSKSIGLVIKDIVKNKGRQFDPEIADKALNILFKIVNKNNDILTAPIIWVTMVIETGDTDAFSIENLLMDVLKLLFAYFIYKIIVDAKNVAYYNKVYSDLYYEIKIRQAAQEELSEERETLLVTLGSIGDGVITADIYGCITFFNRAAETITGWDSSCCIGKHLNDVFTVMDKSSKEADIMFLNLSCMGTNLLG